MEKFTTVKGIGVRTALRALTAPVGQIADAIERKDTRFLVGLQGIGKRTAELIIAELGGNVKQFVIACKRGPAEAVIEGIDVTPMPVDARIGVFYVER